MRWIKKIKKENNTTQNMSKEDYKRTTDKDYFFESNKNDIEFLKQRPVHPRDRLRRTKKIKKEEIENKIILPTSHSLNLTEKKRVTKRKKATVPQKQVPKKIKRINR